MVKNYKPGASVVITKDINKRLLDLKSRASSLVTLWEPTPGESLSGVYLGIRKNLGEKIGGGQLLLKNSKGMFAIWVGPVGTDLEVDLKEAALEEGELISLSYLGIKPQRKDIPNQMFDMMYRPSEPSYELTIENP